MFSKLREKIRNKWRPKVLPKWWVMEFAEEIATENFTRKKCPFLMPFVAMNGKGTVKSVEQECMRDRCEVWDEESGRCSIPTIAKLMRKGAGESGGR